ncbi:MAG TPA: homocysteine S-methyltransferase family protein [Solirubrobacterales bacterium]|nr:homocysteine S-methyltransferase family protein [Solirubrobacterales bacterium]
MDAETASSRVPDGTQLYLADGGLETTMIGERGFELPEFASFVMLGDDDGRDALRAYYREYIEIARAGGTGFIFDTPTWRASTGWGEKLGYTPAAIADVNRDAVELALEIRAAEESQETQIAVCGAIGPQGDAYHPDTILSATEAEDYHSHQVRTFAASGVDLVSALTLTYADEAIGIVAAAGAEGVPVSISFTLETDGRLPSGEELGEAIEKVDAATGGAAAYFMVNCAHPTHFLGVLETGGPWMERLGGIRANASRRSHAELDEMDEIDSGDPEELGTEYRAFKDLLPTARVLGGCCGTDSRHVASVCRHWQS